MKKTLKVFILDDDEQVADVAAKMIEKSNIPCDVITFTEKAPMLAHKNIVDVDLFIVDVNLGDTHNGKEACEKIRKINSIAPFLFISGFDYDYNSFLELDCTFDFIQKPFSTAIFTNRVNTLLNLSKEIRKINDEKKQIEISIVDIFDYSDIYLVILDENFKIKLCSYRLTVDLGYERSNELVGKDWKEFLPVEMATLAGLFGPDNKKIHQEFTNDIISKNEQRIPTKWFNTRIENGVTWTFSIGIPLTKEITKADSIETMRSYWEDIIKKDRTTINVFKDLMD